MISHDHTAFGLWATSSGFTFAGWVAWRRRSRTSRQSSRQVSNDNPFSEAQFKTLKYRPDFPGRFGSIEDARRHCQVFFGWYNDEHRHSGLGLHTPADVHYGLAEAIRDKRAAVLTAAYAAHPERFVRKPPEPPKLPGTAWINPPTETQEATQ